MQSGYSHVRRIAVVGNYLPRQCGIATFTTDLCEALAAEYGATTCFAVPVNDIAAGYPYPTRVRFELEEQDVASYRRAADFLNVNNVDVVCLQHEFGIFGGPAGSHILALARELRMPLVTTLHTVLREPAPHQRLVLQELAQLSERLVVMSQRAVEFLQEIYGVPEERIELIPHGIPNVPFVDPNFYKDTFGVEGKTVLLTFGLLSPNKGIEYVIEALPAVLARHPNVVYLVLGATHPHVRRREGESYRLALQRLARSQGVEKYVIFHNRFVAAAELVEFIGAADIYLTPYLNEAQIVSGTLAYSLGAGKAVVSTPYWYAAELLSDGRGVLAPFRDPQALACRVNQLLDDEAERHAMRKRAYLFGRDMIWSAVARRYMECFSQACEERTRQPRPVFATKPLDQRPRELPTLTLAHLERLTDDTGLLQHAVYTVPRYEEGYTTDDNARALIVVTLLSEVQHAGAAGTERLASRYLAFLTHAFNPAAGRFRNFLSYNRCWLEQVGSEDSHARALWALGVVLGRSNLSGPVGLAAQLFEQALPAVLRFTSPRAWACALLAIHEYLRRFSGDRSAHRARTTLAERLLELYQANAAPDWPWFEQELTYANAVLPHALLLCGRWMARGDMREAALRSLAWLMSLQRSDEGHFAPIGSNGFYRRGGERARFDQQPIEAQTAILACLEAYRQTQDARWWDEAERAFDWFLGRNDARLPLYDPQTGGCCDGLQLGRLNQNQGAESTLAFLLSLLELKLSQHVIHPVSNAALGQ